MTGEDILELLILAVMIIVVLGGMRLYWRMQSDNGYNMGRNYMRDLGFSDEDINRNKDDADRELYVFRKPIERNNKDK